MPDNVKTMPRCTVQPHRFLGEPLIAARANRKMRPYDSLVGLLALNCRPWTVNCIMAERVGFEPYPSLCCL